MNRNAIGSLLLVMFFIVAHGCDASLLSKFRKLAASVGPKKNNFPPPQISPSPSPISGVDSISNGGVVSKTKNRKDAPTPYISPAPGSATDTQITERCTNSFQMCHYHNDINLTACFQSPSNANRELFLLVQNDGDSSLEVNVTILSDKTTFQVIEVSEHNVKKVYVSDGGSPSILLNAGDGKCIIHLGSAVPNNLLKNIPSYASHVTPTHGAYLFGLMAIIIGGTWACCKLAKKGKQVDGIPYQELEMAQPDSPTANQMETADGWDQGWDDDWDDIKTVKSPSARQNGNASLNGFTSKSSDGSKNRVRQS